MITLAVAMAAGAGALARYVVDQVVTRRTRGVFPYGTFLINITGSLVFGLVVGVTVHHHFPVNASLIIGTGFAGGYTTLSTWAWESLALAEVNEFGAMALNIVGSLAVCLAAAAAGLGLALL